VRIHGVTQGEEEGSEQGFGKCFETELPPLSVIPMSLFVERVAIQTADKVEEDGTSAELA